MVEETGFEPVKAKPTDLQSVPFSQTRALLHNEPIYTLIINHGAGERT